MGVRGARAGTAVDHLRVCTDSPAAETTLLMDGATVRRARQFLDDHWCVQHMHLMRPHAETIVGELVTLAVLHGAPPVLLSVDCDGVGATLSVSDADPDPTPLAAPGTGPGRATLVSLLSDEWGVSTRPGGKTVWSRLISA